MNIATYLRVSTIGQTLDPQRLELETCAKAKGWTITAEYSDVMSGTKASRPGLNALMQDIKDGRVKTVVAFKIDRIARSMINLFDLIRELDKYGAAIIIPGSDIDTSKKSPTRKLMMNMLASFSEFERDIIVERTMAGLASARSQGRIGGRKAGQQLVTIDIPQIKTLIEQGMTWREAGKKLGYKRSTLYLRLKEAGWFTS